MCFSYFLFPDRRRHYVDKQNVFFTLFLGYLAFCALEYFWETPWMQLFSLLALLGISILLHADYGWRGFIFLVLMYLLRNEKVSQAIVGSCWLSYEWKACFLFCFTRRLQLAWLSSDPDHVSAPYPEVPAGTCQHSLDEL